MLIAPIPSRGLQPEDLDAIEAFLASNDQAGEDGAERDETLRIARRLLGEALPQ